MFSRSRRSLLKAGLLGSVALAAAGGMYRAATPAASPEKFMLTQDARTVLSTIAPIMLGQSMSSTPAAVDAAVKSVNLAILMLPLVAQREIQDLFGLLTFPPSRRFVAGLKDEWSSASADDVASFLQAWRFTLLLRARAPAPYGLPGKRTFVHSTIISAAVHAYRGEAYSGAPQTVYSDHFLHTHAIDGPIGYKLETAPLHPLLFATTMTGFGEKHPEMTKDFAHTHALLALLRDGFHEHSVGGNVYLRADGSPVLDYRLTPFLMHGFQRALLSMAEIQFAAGAKRVHPLHEAGVGYESWTSARQAIPELPMKPFKIRVASAHAMGGCTMSNDRRQGVASNNGRYHDAVNLSFHDGSLFPTPIGANPQLSIYGIVAMLASRLPVDLTGTPAPSLSTARRMTSQVS